MRDVRPEAWCDGESQMGLDATSASAQLHQQIRTATFEEHQDPSEDADIHTFVFSATISPKVLEFYVNWHEANQRDGLGVPNPVFHMNLVKSISLRDRHALKHIRGALHNICEWGANERLNAQERLHKTILEYSTEVYEAQNEVYSGKKKRRTGNQTSVIVQHIHLDSDEELGSQQSIEANG